MDTRLPLAAVHMNTLQLATDLVKLLNEQISILNSIKSLNESLEKLLAQKPLTQYWNELGVQVQPQYEFTVIIDEKANVVRDELKKLRY